MVKMYLKPDFLILESVFITPTLNNPPKKLTCGFGSVLTQKQNPLFALVSVGGRPRVGGYLICLSFHTVSQKDIFVF